MGRCVENHDRRDEAVTKSLVGPKKTGLYVGVRGVRPDQTVMFDRVGSAELINDWADIRQGFDYKCVRGVRTQ
jgi:hypothetical protein